ncbi:hypothetical protein VARIO8X_110077 [Burkholderiales bacterium 8X]|nr:hypothetical protein VARIO8X_110077 [Burkholderiales bacterium 8X]
MNQPSGGAPRRVHAFGRWLTRPPCRCKGRRTTRSVTRRISRRISRRNGRLQCGFTLIELMITVAVAAILSAVALPYLATFVDRSRARAWSSELESALSYARAEAIARSGPVGVCALEAPGATLCAAANDGSAWINGWMVVDQRAGVSLRTGPPAADGLSVAAGGRGSFFFGRGGLAAAPTGGSVTTGTLAIGRSDGAASIAESCLVISAGGRIRREAPSGGSCSHTAG